uniref:Uncharacterized protein n=1 Tax=Hordeum vulgare subsp. vulgare TaxID=112509 RepID=A0A8I6XDV6_HORVV
MVASITGNRLPVNSDEVAKLLLDSFDRADGDFSIHRHLPEDFLILFSSLTTKARLAGDHFIKSPRFSLSIASGVQIGPRQRRRVGVPCGARAAWSPCQAWHLSTAEHILGQSC